MTSDERDREIEQVVHYLSGASSPAEAAIVRDRLDTDPAFAERMRPYVAAWILEPARGAAGAADSARSGETRMAWLSVRDALERAREAEAAAQPGVAITARDILRPTPVQLRGRRWTFRAILVPMARAAVLVVAAVLTWALYLTLGPAWVRGHAATAWDAMPWSQSIDQVSGHGRRRVVTLPDGSRVDMDQMSWVRYLRDEAMGRSVYFEGRATFTPAVVPNSRFLVRNSTASIGAEEGEFTVDGRRAGRLLVYVARGEVTIWPGGAMAPAATRVGAGMGAVVTADTVIVRER